ncbi:tetracycline resistance protein tetb signature [Lucifera butyrica]|uniref:Tetracycline resistance protein tetb signature n=1 Tax=Lucifera butyrica TaxID=1351585 RepID=A0A498RBV0_9FIRM|nr:MFS transporter [Lucifera butyrica]VBB07732.1 tetracycline resistance protein tetb signature [Lucifera butyrica]
MKQMLFLGSFPASYFVRHPKWKWFILSTVLVGATMSALDVSIVNVAMPTLENGFQVDLATIEWVAMAYMLTLTIFLPLFGRLADMMGRTKLYNMGFVIFVIGSALCGMASTAGFLIGARIVQAIGAGLLQANSVAIITEAFPENELGRAIGLQGATQAVAMAIGPFLGGILITTIGWRSIFYINVPIGVVGTIAALYILPKSTVHKKEKIDYWGTLSFSTGLAFLILGFNQAGRAGWTSVTIISYFSIAVVLLTAFLIVERKVACPMIDLSLFRQWTFSSGNLMGLFSYYILFAVLFFMPFYFERILKLSPAMAGLYLTAVPVAMAAMAPISGYVADKYGAKIMTTSGMIACACSTLLLSSIDHLANSYILWGALITLGIGMGLFTPPNNSCIMCSVPKNRLGVAGGILNMMRSLGLIFGVALSGLLLMLAQQHYMTNHPLEPGITSLSLYDSAFLYGFRLVMLTLVAISLVTVGLSVSKNRQ